MIDGVSYFRAGLALVFWKELPVDIEDIQRIEVTRSPSTASYGDNSFLAVVNIITKHPADVQGTRINVSTGSLNTKTGFISHGNELGEHTHYRVSFSHQQDSGFDTSKNGRTFNDDSYVNKFNIRSSTILDDNSEIDLFANFAYSSVEQEEGDPNQITLPELKQTDQNINLQYTNQLTNQNLILVKTFVNHWRYDRDWNTCYPAITFSDALRAVYLKDPQLAADIVSDLPNLPNQGTPETDALRDELITLGPQAFQSICGKINDDYQERRLGFEIQNTHVFSPKLRMVAGLGIKHSRSESETFLNGETAINKQYFFANIEFKPSRKSTLNIGTMWESEENRIKGFEHSPRTALNFHITPNQTIRFIYAEARRTPDTLESDMDWNYTMRDMSPALYDGSTKGLFYINTKPDNKLKSEKIYAKEISYYINLPENDTALDIKLFREDLHDLISEKVVFDDFHPTNNNSHRLEGVEVQLEYKPSGRFNAYAAYAYMENDSPSDLERALYSEHIGSTYVSYKFNKDWRSSFAYYGANSIAGFSYDRFDFIVSKQIKIVAHSILDIAVKTQYYGSKRAGYLSNKNLSTEYDSDTHYFISVSWRN